MKRGASGLSLVVAIDKSAGHSSHSALGGLKYELGERRVGHCGTLDPFATGILVALIGPATGLSRYLTMDRKSYMADIVFGRTTATDDIEGPTVEQFDVSCNDLEADEAQSIVNGFKGDILQVPPAYSALKIQGRRAYDEARKGRPVTLEPRPVHVYDAEIIDIGECEDEGRIVPRWTVMFDVSKGTYIRSLARDIGKAVGAGAYLGSLRRIKSGGVGLEHCILEGSSASEVLGAALDPVEMLGFKVIFPDDKDIERVSNGASLDPSEMDVYTCVNAMGHEEDLCTTRMREFTGGYQDGEKISICSPSGLKAIYSFDDHSKRLTAERVFQTEVSRGPGDIV